MSHARSFAFYGQNESLVKKALDQYKIEVLNGGVLAPIKRWGFGGIDEATYAFFSNLLPGQKKRKLAALEQQIQYTDEAIGRMTGEPDILYSNLVGVQPNPATFFTLSRARKKLKAERLNDMASNGQKLYPSEAVKLEKYKVSETIDGILEKLGAVGEFLGRNAIIFGAVAVMTLTGLAVPRLIEHSRIYNEAVQMYTADPYGQRSLPIKRDLSWWTFAATANLEYSEWTTTDDKGNTTRHEIYSNPQLARNQIISANNLVVRSLDNVEALPISENERASLANIRDKSSAYFHRAITNLTGRLNISITYYAEISDVRRGGGIAENAVPILESHMDPKVVEGENKGHLNLILWALLTSFGGAASLGLGYGAARNIYMRKYEY